MKDNNVSHISLWSNVFSFHSSMKDNNLNGSSDIEHERQIELQDKV